jgi:uncharacterized membrane protein
MNMRELAIFAYFPVIGWFFPMFFGTRCTLCQYHARQGFAAFVFFTLCSAVVWLVNHSVPTFISIVESLLYGAVILMYAILLVWGAVTAAKSEEAPLPIIGKRAANLPL